MKGGGGGDNKQGRGRSAPPLLHLESQRFRRASVVVVVGCFLFVLVFLLSSSTDVAVLETLRPKVASLRAPAAAESTPLRSSDGHEVHKEDSTTAAGVRTSGVAREAEPEEPSAAAAATATATSSSDFDDRAAPAGAADDEPVRDNAVHVTPPAIAAQGAMGTTPPPPPPRHGLPGDTGINTRAAADSVDQRNLQHPLCDFSGPRADVCDFAGDIRLDARASTFLVVDDDERAGGANWTTYKVRPYPRKGDATAMGRVTELTVVRAAGAPAPRCTHTHAAPAVVFSAGGYAGNLFHDFTDVVVPLYGTAARFRGDAVLVVADAAPRWVARYDALLRGLSSRHEALIDLARAAAAGEVHCFPRALVTPRAHRELLIDERGQQDDGGAAATMPGFSRFLRRALSLPRETPTRPGRQKIKPRLLIISRRGTRRLLNVDAVARAAEEAGFEAVVTGADLDRDDVARVRLVNSFDALVGVHGAGLTNMVFLPPGATVVQIVPWGGLRWIARLDFGDPAEAMGLRYIQYEVAVEESTLKDKYPRDHEVFTNPTALHRKGFTFLRHTFLNGQDIIVDVHRFRPVLQQALRNLAQ